jgi:hypothetical protein
VEFVASKGYTLDEKESSFKGKEYKYATFRNEDDKVLVLRSKKPPFNWMYLSRRDPSDKGNVINFLKKRGYSYKEINKELCSFTGHTVERKKRFKSKSYDFSSYGKSGSDFSKYFEARGLKDIADHPYFKSVIKTDDYSNAVFPIRNINREVVGIETKNFETIHYIGKQTLEGSSKVGSAWFNDYDNKVSSETLFVGEAVIDVISYWILAGRPKIKNPIFLATCGSMSVETMQMIKAIAKKQKVQKIVTLFDNDKAGWKYDFTLLLHLNDFITDIDIQYLNWNNSYRFSIKQEVLKPYFDDKFKVEEGHYILNPGEEQILFYAIKDLVPLEFKVFNPKSTFGDFNEDLMNSLSLNKQSLIYYDEDTFRFIVSSLKQSLSKNEISVDTYNKKLDYFTARKNQLIERLK